MLERNILSNPENYMGAQAHCWWLEVDARSLLHMAERLAVFGIDDVSVCESSCVFFCWCQSSSMQTSRG